MAIETNWSNTQHDETQFTTIRELMLDASIRGRWLTLAEIAESTEFGEASISAQLRHLRKPRFGRYRVEKRRREMSATSSFDFAVDAAENEPKQERQIFRTSAPQSSDVPRILDPWEYRVFAPQQTGNDADFEAERLVSQIVEQMTCTVNASPSRDQMLPVHENESEAAMEVSDSPASEITAGTVVDDGVRQDLFEEASPNLSINLRGGEVCDR